MDNTGPLAFFAVALAGTWAVLFLPPQVRAFMDRRHFQKLEKQRRRQYAAMKRRAG